MVVSTGVGGGIVLDGRLLDGAQGNAGHIGHVIVDPDGRACACGGRGCLEAEASGTAIAAITGRPPKEASPDVIARTGRLVGLAVASTANLLDLKLAVVAGSVALGFGDPFFAAAQAEIDARARLDFSRGTKIRPAALGADGPLVGAAAVGCRIGSARARVAPSLVFPPGSSRSAAVGDAETQGQRWCGNSIDPTGSDSYPPSMASIEPDIVAYYDRGKEQERLAERAAGRLEFIRTQIIFRAALPAPPADVLDIGGAAGVHAQWLAATAITSS